jgi:oligosaccharide repeat unit polymerase
MVKCNAIGRMLFIMALLVALVATNLLIAGLSLHGLLITFIILALVLPMGLRHIQGKLDLFEPLVLGNIAIGAMFVGRPLADLATQRTTHLGYNITSTFDQALLVVFVGILAFQFGYLSPFARQWARRMPAPSRFRPYRAALAAWLFFLLGGALFGVFLAKGGAIGLLFILLQGRATGNNEIFTSSTGYFYNGILMWAASALIFFALATALKRRSNYLYLIAVALPLFIFFGARGTRSQLLPLILAVPVFWYLWKHRRPSANTLMIAAFIGLILIGWQREIRTADIGARHNAGAVLIEAFASPLKQLGDIFSGADDEMFDSIANELLVVPSKIGYRPGGSLGDLFIRSVPRPLWPDKPLETNDAVVNALWSKHYALSRASAAFSIIGPFYVDSGLAGVTIGMFFIGMVLAGSWHWYRQHSYNINAMLIYSMGLPFVAILMRGTLPDTVARMLFMVIPLMLAMWLSRLRFRSRIMDVGEKATMSR